MPALVIAAVLFALSSVPGRDIPSSEIPHLDKLVHVLGYLALGVGCARGLLHSGWRRRSFIWLAGAALATVYGATDELHQLFVPGRAPDIADLVADCVGAFIGSGLMVLRARLRPRLGD